MNRAGLTDLSQLLGWLADRLGIDPTVSQIRVTLLALAIGGLLVFLWWGRRRPESRQAVCRRRAMRGNSGDGQTETRRRVEGRGRLITKPAQRAVTRSPGLNDHRRPDY